MIKLAAFTDEISQDIAHACDVMREMGATGAEVRGVWNTSSYLLSDAQVRDVRRILDDHGIAACSIGSPFGKCELDDPAAIATHMDILRRSADVAHALDCRLVRGFAFWGPLRNVACPWSHAVLPRPWGRILGAFEPVPEILAQCDMTLGIENEYSCWVGTAAHAREFVDRMQCDSIQIVWDPANHVHDVEGGERIPAFPDGYRAVKGRVVHVHVKDAGPTQDGDVCDVFLTTGLVDWEAQLRQLHEDGYDGYVSLETHVSAEHCPESLRAPYGHYLAGNPQEAASRVALAYLRDVIGRV